MKITIFQNKNCAKRIASLCICADLFTLWLKRIQLDSQVFGAVTCYSPCGEESEKVNGLVSL